MPLIVKVLVIAGIAQTAYIAVGAYLYGFNLAF